MFSVSSRKLTYAASITFTTLLSAWLILKLNEAVIMNIKSPHTFIEPQRIELQSDINLNDYTNLEDRFVHQYHLDNTLTKPNEHVLTQLSKYNRPPNPFTTHIRLGSVTIRNISMVPSDDFAPEFLNYKYFNPAILPLPSYVYTTSGYRYLLVSRLVTAGHHQESHVCFADICSTEASSSYQNRICTESDIELLGHQGGLRCITKPEKINIPPTPSRRCSGAWATFPDIPGFHDPRIFWSGSGEPLIEVNSGSAYGCVGLWLQDLRAVHEQFELVLDKREKGLVRKDQEKGKDVGTQLDPVGLGAPMVYRYLTEITKNPEESRNEVEKNWVLFFPREQETWVQYDMMGQIEEEEEDSLPATIPLHSAPRPEVSQHVNLPTSTQASSIPIAALESTVEETGRIVTLPEASDTESTSVMDLPLESITLDESNRNIEVELKAALNEAGPAKRAERTDSSKPPIADSEPTWPSSPTPDVSANISKGRLVSNISIDDLARHPSSPIWSSSLTVRGGRTLAQLHSHGYTTPNLTSPFEPSCFNLIDHSHAHDVFGNHGHWHQGSNSLRLIFCTREQFRARQCIPRVDRQREDSDLDWYEYEKLLIQEGLVLHFSIVHRKFNNIWDLPMRYERYFLVWEARKPFRMIGISSNPLLFGNERARPWSAEEDVNHESLKGNKDEDDGRQGQEEVGEAYFTYTPSVAWAWRPNSDDGAWKERGHEDLGTGYLGEDIVVGIGMDDIRQGFVRVGIDEVLSCLRLCPA